MANISKDDLWKVFSLLMSALVLPLPGWVWNTNVKVAELQNDLGDAEDVISVLVAKKDQYEAKEVELASQIIGIEKDIEYMKGSLGRIEELVTRRDLCDKMKALELFLQDQEDHKEYCPDLEWQQPAIETYREKLESQLPKECKKEE